MNTPSNRQIATFAAALLFASTLMAAPFDLLFRVMKINGPCEVKLPQEANFVPAKKGKAYPYGTIVRTGEKGAALIVLSSKDALSLQSESSLELLDREPGSNQKIARLLYGEMGARTDDANEPYDLVVESPVGRAVALTGSSKFKLSESLEGFTLTVEADGSSSFKIVGSQFIIPVLKNGFGASITSVRDNSMTRIQNLLGDYTILINTGEEEDPPPMVDDAPNSNLIAIESTRHSAVKVWRTHAKVGNRLIVSVLATDANGRGRENFAFAIGQPNIASRAVYEDSTNAPAGDFASEDDDLSPFDIAPALQQNGDDQAAENEEPSLFDIF